MLKLSFLLLIGAFSFNVLAQSKMCEEAAVKHAKEFIQESSAGKCIKNAVKLLEVSDDGMKRLFLVKIKCKNNSPRGYSIYPYEVVEKVKFRERKAVCELASIDHHETDGPLR